MIVAGLGQCCWDTLAVVDAYSSPDTKVEATVWEEQAGGPTATALVAMKCRHVGAQRGSPRFSTWPNSWRSERCRCH